MTAAEIMNVSIAAGIKITVDEDDLILEAPAMPLAQVVDALSRHKAEVVSLMRAYRAVWVPADGQIFFDERAGIAEFDGGLPRAEDQAHSLLSCVVEWLNEHPAPSETGFCAWCGKPECATAVVLPSGTELGAHISLHGECWPGRHHARRNEAHAALGAMGIDVKFPDDFGKMEN